MAGSLREELSVLERSALESLSPIFPQHSDLILITSIKHASNQSGGTCSLQACIDDILDLRTYSELTANESWSNGGMSYQEPAAAPPVASPPRHMQVKHSATKDAKRQFTPALGGGLYIGLDTDEDCNEDQIKAKVAALCQRFPDVCPKYARRIILDRRGDINAAKGFLRTRMGLYPKSKPGPKRKSEEFLKPTTSNTDGKYRHPSAPSTTASASIAKPPCDVTNAKSNDVTNVKSPPHVTKLKPQVVTQKEYADPCNPANKTGYKDLRSIIFNVRGTLPAAHPQTDRTTKNEGRNANPVQSNYPQEEQTGTNSATVADMRLKESDFEKNDQRYLSNFKAPNTSPSDISQRSAHTSTFQPPRASREKIKTPPIKYGGEVVQKANAAESEHKLPNATDNQKIGIMDNIPQVINLNTPKEREFIDLSAPKAVNPPIKNIINLNTPANNDVIDITKMAASRPSETIDLVSPKVTNRPHFHDSVVVLTPDAFDTRPTNANHPIVIPDTAPPLTGAHAVIQGEGPVMQKITPVQTTLVTTPVQHTTTVTTPTQTIIVTKPVQTTTVPTPMHPEAATRDPLPAMQREVLNQLNEHISDVCLMFPQADVSYIRDLLSECTHSNQERVQCCVNKLLNNNNFPKKVTATSTVSSPAETRDNNSTTGRVGESYLAQVINIISVEFPRISTRDIRTLLHLHNFHYAPTHNYLLDLVTSAQLKPRFLDLAIFDDSTSSVSHSRVCLVPFEYQKEPFEKISFKGLVYRLLKKGRHLRDNISFPVMDEELRKDVEFVAAQRKVVGETEVNAESININEYAAQSQGIECGCCYCEHPFEEMVQCADGHLFCAGCLQNYAKEAVFGQGKSSLDCMDGECEAKFLKSELQRCLASEVMAKYEDRCQEEALNLADIIDLVRCPHCDFAAILDANDKVMSCQNEKCLKETCRHCKEPWEEHFGKSCKEIEKKDETALRLQFEEKMTMAKIRTCFRCKASFTKSDGCNKMTCRCGAKMCYICRKPKINYNHFCGHPREPGHGCTKCNACSLWTNPEEDDNRAVKEIQEEASRARKEQGYAEEKLIGAPDEPPKKKQKTSAPAARP